MKEKINYITFAGVILILIVLAIFYQDWRSSRNFSSQPTSTTQEKTSAVHLRRLVGKGDRQRGQRAPDRAGADAQGATAFGPRWLLSKRRPRDPAAGDVQGIVQVHDRAARVVRESGGGISADVRDRLSW